MMKYTSFNIVCLKEMKIPCQISFVCKILDTFQMGFSASSFMVQRTWSVHEAAIRTQF